MDECIGSCALRPKRGGSRGNRSRPVISCADFTGGKQRRPESELAEAEEDWRELKADLRQVGDQFLGILKIVKVVLISLLISRDK